MFLIEIGHFYFVESGCVLRWGMGRAGGEESFTSSMVSEGGRKGLRRSFINSPAAEAFDGCYSRLGSRLAGLMLRLDS